MHSGLVVIVNGELFPVIERSGCLKADMGGRFGWTAVWAPTTVVISEHTGNPVDTTAFVLIERIRKTMAEGNFGAPTVERHKS